MAFVLAFAYGIGVGVCLFKYCGVRRQSSSMHDDETQFFFFFLTPCDDENWCVSPVTCTLRGLFWGSVYLHYSFVASKSYSSKLHTDGQDSSSARAVVMQVRTEGV